MIRLAPSAIRLAAPAAAVVMSAVTLAACGSSSTSAGSSTTPSTSSSTSPSMSESMSTAPSTGAIDPNVAALCTGLNSADLASLSHAKDPTAAEQAWSRLAADAPAAIKGDMQTIDTYLKAVIARDYTTLSTAVTNLQTAVTHLETYITTNCHS